MAGHLIVCGLGQVGYRIANLLLDLGERVTVITLGAREEWLREIRARDVTVILGDARDEALLLSAGLLEAKALLACTDGDLVNIEIAIDAKRVHPGLSVVTRLFDQNLARQLEESIGIERALGMSAIAAPAFASAAFGDTMVSTFAIGEQRYVIERVRVGSDSPLLGRSPKWLAEHRQIATLFRIDNRGVAHVEPEPDSPFSEGDSVMLIGEPTAMEAFAPTIVSASRSIERQPTLLQTMLRVLNPLTGARFVGRLLKTSSLEVRAVLTLIAVLVLISAFVFQVGLGLSFSDALYFVITTVTTVGYGDITPREPSLGLKVYGMLLMLLGPATLALLYSIVTDYIVTARLQQFVGRQRIPESDHVIVAGLGNVGYRTVDELLRIGARVVAIDSDAGAKYVPAIRSKVPVVIGDAREAETLRRAGADRAAAVVATTSEDVVNLSIGLAVENLNPQARTVLRLFDGEFANKVQSVLSVDVALSASLIAAPAFVGAALYPNSVASFVLRGELLTLVISEHGKLAKVPERTRELFVLSSDGRTEALTDRSTLGPNSNVLAVIARPLVPPGEYPPPDSRA